jgi:hypothetical protein
METVLVDGGRTEPAAVVSAATIPWGPIIAGAIVAAAVSAVLLAFGSALGLSVASTSPTWRDTSVFLWLVSGLFLVFVSLAAFGFGGYIAGRLRPRFIAGEVEGERLLRDGLSGLMTWGLAVLLAGFIAAGVAAVSGGIAASAPATPSASAGEGVLSYELDRLLRTDGHVGDADWTYRRAEASRILLTAGGHNGVTNEDRVYLTSLVAGVTKIPAPDAEARTNQAIADAHTAISNARKAAILEAFMIGAALLLGAAIAWFAAEEGGRERDAGTLPTWNWRLRHPVVRVA